MQPFFPFYATKERPWGGNQSVPPATLMGSAYQQVSTRGKIITCLLQVTLGLSAILVAHIAAWI